MHYSFFVMSAHVTGGALSGDEFGQVTGRPENPQTFITNFHINNIFIVFILMGIYPIDIHINHSVSVFIVTDTRVVHVVNTECFAIR